MARPIGIKKCFLFSHHKHWRLVRSLCNFFKKTRQDKKQTRDLSLYLAATLPMRQYNNMKLNYLKKFCRRCNKLGTKERVMECVGGGGSNYN
jgi:hypothetical protein